MRQLLPFFRVLPAVLFAYGIVLTYANIVEFRFTASRAGMVGSYMTEMRITYLAGLVRSFYDLFYLLGMAALVTAANKYLEEKL